MAATEAQKRAVAKYDAKNTTRVILKLNNTTDADILARLDASGNKQGYIKALIRADMQFQSTLPTWGGTKRRANAGQIFRKKGK